MREEETSRCPQCGAIMFSDMDTCYDCLYGRDSDAGWDGDVVPLEAYPEDVCGATIEEMPAKWALRMSTASVDVVIPVPDTGLMVGRGTSCDVILHAKSVSRQHVHVEPDAEGMFVRDLGARNPCSIGGRRVKGEAHMREGETLSICGTSFVLERVNS